MNSCSLINQVFAILIPPGPTISIGIFARDEFFLGRWACNLAAQNGDGSFGKREYGLRRGVDGRNHRRQIWIGMSIRVRAVPNILFAAKGDVANFARKMSGPFAAFKGDPNGMRILPIFVDKK